MLGDDETNGLCHLTKIKFFLNKSNVFCSSESNLTTRSNTGEERKYQVEEIITLLSDASPEYKDQIMTIADQLRQQGLHEGVILGEKKGVEKSVATVARNMIAKGP